MRVSMLVMIPARAQGHDDFLHGGVAGALADAVDRAFGLPGAAFDRGQGIGDGQAQIVMAMTGENDVLLFEDGQLGQQMGEDFTVGFGRGIADGVGQIYRRRAGLHGGVDDLFQKIQLRPAGVFGREFNIIRILFGLPDRIHADLDDLLFSFFQLVLAMDFAGGAENVNAFVGRGLDGFAGAVDIAGRAAGQAADDAVADLGGDGVNGFEIAVGTDGESGFDDVDAHGFEELGDLQLFRAGEGCAGRLLAVAQGGVEDSHGVHVFHGGLLKKHIDQTNKKTPRF